MYIESESYSSLICKKYLNSFSSNSYYSLYISKTIFLPKIFTPLKSLRELNLSSLLILLSYYTLYYYGQ